jgi:D-tyrosyl-tRNA(Tyr) deacylase
VRCVIQRVRSARVTVNERVVGAIGPGLLALVGVDKGDTAADADYIAGKIRDVRIFEDEGDETGRKRMNRSVVDVRGAVLVVSQFTLSGDLRRGRRPSFDDAAPPEMARQLYEAVVQALRTSGLDVETGEFQAMMVVALENDGPVTILIDSKKRF